MKDGWYVWSSGLEEWEPIAPGTPSLKRYLHSKRVGEKLFEIFADDTGRYIARVS